MFLRAATVVFCSYGLTAPVWAQEPSPEARIRVDAFFAALASGSPDRFEAMAQEHFSPDMLARRSPEERKALVERVRMDFGALKLEHERERDPGSFELTVQGERGGRARLELTLEPTSPRRITRIAIEAGAPEQDAPRAPAPPVQGSMGAAELSRALENYLAGLSSTDGFAGVVLVAKEGQPLFERGFGQADRDRKVPITPATRFNLASIGKAFTRTAIGQLVEQGKLALTDTLGALLPDYPNEAARMATVDQLLNHAGGIADFFGPRFDQASKEKFRSNADYFQFVAGQPLLFAPGSRSQYCNGCYIVLGAIIERVSGLPYEEFVRKNVFERAGMAGAGFLAMDDHPADTAIGYTRPDATTPLRDNRGLHGARGSAAGGSYARAADLLAFDNALREGRLLGPKLTGWFLGGEPTSGRAREPYNIAGGAPGANAILESDGLWTVVVLGNLDPPNAGRVGTSLMRQLAR